MKTFADRLNHAMNLVGMSNAMLGEAVGMSQPSIWKLTSGRSATTRKLVEIANALNVRPEWLSTGQGPMQNDSLPRKVTEENQIPPESHWGRIEPWDSNTPIRDDEVEVPFLKDIEFACGDGRINDVDYNGFMLRFSKATLRRVGANSDGSGVLCFPAAGDSMEPVIPDGTTVAVNTNDKRIVDGKIYAINEDGWKRIKQLYRTGPETVSIRSFNNAHPPEDKSLDKVEIIGRIFWYSVLL
ncbi:TPA_asm: helix-turn-helix transcriptional regulator [Salmonella enterica]|nr:helix-turn-helix transcriptional regulator [Salmonella enterica]HAC8271042.1 helix-turn-helix transcriptional regulator [Salmonella enterica]